MRIGILICGLRKESPLQPPSQPSPNRVQQSRRLRTEQASAPTSTPELVATEEELALEWLRENPKCQPQTVKLLQHREFTLKRNGLVRGSTTVAAAAASASALFLLQRFSLW